MTHDEHAFGLVFSRGCVNATVSTVFFSLTVSEPMAAFGYSWKTRRQK